MLQSQTSEFRKYDCIFIDVVNFCYKVFTKKSDTTIQVGSKLIYKNSICECIRAIEDFTQKYLHSDGSVYLLFDNYFSRADLKTAFMFADREDLSEAYKKTRKKEYKEFYNSVNFIKYYFLLESPKYHTLQIPGLEADDLVKPILQEYCSNKSCLLITSDLDWCRYLRENPRIDWLPKLGETPQVFEDLEAKLKFPVSERNIILYKAIFGDVSDNIEGLAHLNERTFSEFISLISKISYMEEITLLSRDVEARKESTILQAIAKNERQLSINIQLVSTIPCDIKIIKENLTTGSESKTQLKTIRLALGLDEAPKFVFGNIKRPRV